jgi:hypothetical protein
MSNITHLYIYYNIMNKLPNVKMHQNVPNWFAPRTH